MEFPSVKELNAEYVANKRWRIKAMLRECTDSQCVLFQRLYHNGVDAIPEDQLDRAYDQCWRTVQKNRKGGFNA